MKILKFYQFFESISDCGNIILLIILFNIFSKFSSVSIKVLLFILSSNKYDGDYTFVTFDYKAKIITKIEYNKKLLYIVTFLGGNEKLKEDISEIILI